MKTGRVISRIINLYLFLMMGFVVVGQSFAQSNYVLKTGDTMTGTLIIEAPSGAPAFYLRGSSNSYKYIYYANTNNLDFWAQSMDPKSSGGSLSFWCSTDPAEPCFYISTNGVLYGNAAGLTNLNVALAIPNGSITANKVSTGIVTVATLPEPEDIGAASQVDLDVATSSIDDVRALAPENNYYLAVITNGVMKYERLNSRDGLAQWLSGISNNSFHDKLGISGARLVGSSCLTLDGSDDYCSYPQSVINDIDVSSVTAFIRFKLTRKSHTEAIISFGKNTYDRYGLYNRFGKVYCTRWNGDHCDRRKTQGTVTLNQWHSAAICVSNSTITRLYVDGVAITNASADTAQVAASGYALGMHAVGTGIYAFQGSLIDHRLIEGGLSDEEAMALHNNTLTGKIYRIMSPLAEGSATTAYDTSGNANHGMLHNAGDGASCWNESQDIFHYNLTAGFNTNGIVKIPAQIDGLVDAVGNSISNPGGPWHNGAETKLLQSTNNAVLKTADQGFWYSAAGTPNPIGYDDLLCADPYLIQCDLSDKGQITSIRTFGDADQVAQVYAEERAGYKVTMHAENGFEFSGGPIVGDGSGLSLDLANYVDNQTVFWNAGKKELFAATSLSTDEIAEVVKDVLKNLPVQGDLDSGIFQ